MSVKARYLSPAKINLGLEILRKRADGYHEINTLFYKIEEPHDTLIVSHSKAFGISCSNPNIPLDDSNLVRRAVIAYCTRLGVVPPPLEIHIEKTIPVGAGLGGGSSNAAAALAVIGDYFQGMLKPDNLHEIATGLGADVPFFLLNSRAALGRGIGDELTSLDFKLGFNLLIVNDPLISVSTREAYAGISLSLRRPTDFKSVFEAGRLLPETVLNDFETTVFSQHPRLLEIKERLYDAGASLALMSGSGSSLFGLFEPALPLEQISESLRLDGLSVYQNVADSLES